MNIVILDAETLGNADLKKFEKFGKLTVYSITPKELTKERTKEADIIITNKVVIDKEIMDNAPNLRLICVAATGMNNVDLDYASRKMIAVKNVAGYSTESVVQHTFALAFYLIESLGYYDEYVKTGKWAKSQIFTHLGRPFFEIAGKTWGIIGLGTIGKRVADIAKSFGCNILYYSASGVDRSSEYERVELEELLKRSDIVSIHAPLNEKTKNLLHYENISLMKDNSILLNLGRGGIINERDLAKAIDEKKIYAGIDVTEQEPINPDNPLNFVKNKEQLFITPHIAWTSIEARERLIEGIAKNIEEFLSRGIK
ncbi:D-2-hydroxyacid dehydrogenase [Nitrosophilus alvini]|uniref:D-2-hydroxyacid dehydrogenase n=1 Tax=Nitrosophilus alvini TaxID=2714855 RepID=UPI00190B221B|nr:D-2-hydroxyacid dehydrogenase [Nitrosophilus alvini]